MTFAAIDEEIYTPAAVVIASIITAATVVWKTIYEKKQNTLTESPKVAPSKKRMRISFDVIAALVFLPVSVWLLVSALRDSGPVTRVSILLIVFWSGSVFFWFCVSLFRIALFIAQRQAKKETDGRPVA